MTTANVAAFDRTLPHNLEAERSVLGAILLHDEVLEHVVDVVKPEHFYRDAHRRVFKHMLALHDRREPIDLTTLRETLSRTSELDEVGGPAYIAALVDGVPRSTNIEHYARIVRDKADLREVIYAANKMLADAYAAGDDARLVIDRAEQQIFEIAQGEQIGGFVKLADIMPRVMEQLQAWHDTGHGVSGLPSGFADLDAVTRGFQPANLIILAARPSMGKSSLALNIAQHVAGLGKTVGIFSLEMSHEELAVRTLTAEAHVDGHYLQRGWIHGAAAWARLATAMDTLSALPLFIDESPFVTVLDIRSRARRLKAQYGLNLVIVDYTQLMVGHERKDTRTLEIAAITRAFKALSKDLAVPVIALSQLNRDLERRDNKRPMLSDLRDSGALEQDADLVLFIYRDEVYDPDTADKGVAEIIIAKQRNGPIGTVKLAWRAEETRFANLEQHAPAAEDRQLPLEDR